MTITTKAWVVFSGQADLPWLKILKPGFRHCYALLNNGHQWITIDPLSSFTDVIVHDISQETDLPSFIAQNGFTVLEASICPVKKQAPVMIFTCVEAVKRILGIHHPFIITPWQLYRFLHKGSPREGNTSEQKDKSIKQTKTRQQVA